MYAQNSNEMGWEDTTLKAMSQHFSNVAKKYRNLRTTDSEPISLIVDKLKNLDHVEAVDVGCGAGRYDPSDAGITETTGRLRSVRRWHEATRITLATLTKAHFSVGSRQ